MKERYKGLVIKRRPNGRYLVPHLGDKEYRSAMAAKQAITKSGR